jgi:hypothetical protein
MDITFQKTGREIKTAVQTRRTQLLQRLERRNQALDAFMQDPRKVRSYLVRSSQPYWSHERQTGPILYSADDISSEEQQEITQLCQRIFEIEQELHRLALLVTHMDDNQVFELELDDLIAYGFSAETGTRAD